MIEHAAFSIAAAFFAAVIAMAYTGWEL